MRLARRASALAVALAAAVVVAAPADARPRCEGKKATIVGSDGPDVLNGRGGHDVIVARGGDDRILGGGGRDTICTGPGNDAVEGGSGSDRVQGGLGADFLDGGPGSDRLLGGDENDIILGGPGGELARGGAGDDRLYGGLQDDMLSGGDGDDLVIGSQGSDELAGDEGEDWLRGDTQRDSYDGGGGADTVSFAAATPPEGEGDDENGVTVKLQIGDAYGDDAHERVRRIENVIGSPFRDSLTGHYPQGFGDSVFGLANVNDHCLSFRLIECGTDPRTGSEAIAFVDFAPRDPGLIVLGATGADRWRITTAGTEIAITATTALAAGPGCAPDPMVAMRIECESPEPLGYVVAYGDRGNDSIAIGTNPALGATVKLDGGRGSDRLEGGPAGDILIAGGLGAEVRPVQRTDADVLIGGEGDDALFSKPGGDQLYGGPGADQLASDDPCGHVLDGGPGGSDVIGFDPLEPLRDGKGPKPGVIAKIGGLVDYRERTCSVPGRITKGAEILEGSRLNDALIGDNRSNGLLQGGHGNDLIKGRGGNDGLRGEEGADVLLGGAGRDQLQASDGVKDRRLDCGPGGKHALTDRRDPPTRRCR